MKLWYIYQISCRIEGVGDYIGRTTRPLAREREHRKASSGRKLRAAIELLGAEHFRFEIIDTCASEEEAMAMETRYIRELGTGWPNGLNVSGAGPGVYSTRSYEGQSLHRTKAQVDRWASANAREQQSKTLKRVKSCAIEKRREAARARRRWQKPEYREKQRVAHLGRTHSDATKQRLRALALERSAARGGPKRRRGRPPTSKSKAEIRAQIRQTWEKNRDRNVATARKAAAAMNNSPEIAKKRQDGIRRYYARIKALANTEGTA